MAEHDLKLNEQLAKQFCDYLRAGHYRQTAAQLCRVHPTTVSDWMGKEGEPYASFQLAVREAEAEAIRVQLAKITESPEPADAKWYLARKDPDHWAETRRVDVSGRLDIGTKLDGNALKDPDARQALITLAKSLFASRDDDPGPDGPESQ